MTREGSDNGSHHGWTGRGWPQDDGYRGSHPEPPWLPEPYPPIKVERPDHRHARLLLDDYAGQVSEFTAIAQYTHHHLSMETTEGWEEVSRLESGISIVEMHHLEMLGQTIILLGGSVRFRDGRGNYWSGRYPDYHDRQPCRQLQADIQAEEAAIAQYEEHIRRIDDVYVQALLRRIIKDEQQHLQLFRAAAARQGCRDG